MRQITTAFKSSKAATALALLLLAMYATTEFGNHPSQQAQANIPAKPDAVSLPGSFDDSKLAAIFIPTPQLRPADLPTVEQPFQITVASLTVHLDNIAFDLQNIRAGQEVPRHFVENMPTDILDVENIQQRKNIFFSVTLPLILRANEDIRKERNNLMALAAQLASGEDTTFKQSIWLNQLAEKYKGNASDIVDLINRVDVIPVSLALSQAIEESGWGTSRFAREGNALFGQRVWSQGNGLVPHERKEGEVYEVKAFDHLFESISDYALNLNRHIAYKEFRESRANQRRAFGKLDSYELAKSLTSYSERGEHYVDTLRALMDANQLSQFDTVRLADEQVAQIFNLSNN